MVCSSPNVFEREAIKSKFNFVFQTYTSNNNCFLFQTTIKTIGFLYSNSFALKIEAKSIETVKCF